MSNKEEYPNECGTCCGQLDYRLLLAIMKDSQEPTIRAWCYEKIVALETLHAREYELVIGIRGKNSIKGNW